MRFVLAAAVAACALTAAPAFAQEGPVFTDVGVYGNIGYSRTEGEGADLNAATARLGARLNRFVGIEAEGSIGVGSEEVDFLGEDFEISLEHQFGAYLVGFVPVSPNADLFARLGVGMSEFSVDSNVPGLNGSDDVQTWQWGLGGQYFWDGVNGIRADYTRHEVHDDEEFEDGIDVFSIAYVRKFR